jgi:hypothetical protein
MPDYGWAYINLDVLKTITGPTGSILMKSSSTELSGSKFLAYATASNKVGIGLNFPTVLPSYQLDVSASSGQLIAARYTGDVVISGSVLITGSLTVATLHADTVISSSNLIVRDEVIGLGFGSGSGQTGSVGDRGFVFGLDGDLNQAFLWDQTSGSFILGKIGAAGPEGTTFDIPEANLSKLKVGEVTGSKGRFDFTNGNVVITGSYYGDGSNLQNLPAPTSLSGTTAQLTTGVETSGYLRVSGSSTLNAVTATTISGSSTLQAVGPTILGNNLSVSGSSTLKELFSTEISASGGMQIVNETILGGNLTVSGTVSVDNNISGSGTFQAVGSTILGNSLTVSGSSVFDGTIKANNLGADTDNTVVIVNSSGLLKTDEVDSRIFGSTLVDGSGASGQITLWNDTDTVQGSSALTYNGSALLIDDAISGSGTLQAVGDTVLGGKLNVSSSAEFANTVSGSSTLQMVGDSVFGGKLNVSSSATFGSSISGSSTLQAVGDSVLGGKLNVSSSATFGSSISGSSTLQAVGNTVIGGNLSVSGTINFSGGTIDNTTIGSNTPAPVNQTAGSVKYRSKDNGDSPYTIVTSDYIIGVDTSGGAVQINLQAASAAGTGRMLVIKDIKGTAGTNNITIEPNGSELIDRQANMIIAANSGSVILFCDGTEYFIAGTR